jgi:hypothetical protein
MVENICQILPPRPVFRSEQTDRRPRSRAVAVTSRLRASGRDALFVHIGSKNAVADGSVGFITQHLDQEWVHRKAYIDPRRGTLAYRRARNIHVQRLDLFPPI